MLFISVPALHWHECALVSVCACSCVYACVNENIGEKECYEEMNERNDLKIAKKKKRYQFVTLGVDSVALHHMLVYVWETLQCDDSLKNQHQLLSLTDFWRSLEKAKFPLMRIHTKRMMSLFNKPLFSNLFA